MSDFFKELVQAFEKEAAELVEGASGAVMQLEAGGNGEGPAALLNNLGRKLHTLKGSAATCGLLDCSELAHKLEDLIAPYKKEGEAPEPEALDILLKGLDVMMSRVRAHAKGQGKGLGNVAQELPELFIAESLAAPAAPADAEAAPARRAGDAQGEERVEMDSATWRVEQEQVLRILREVERLREFRLGLADRAKGLSSILQKLQQGAFGEAALGLKAPLGRLKVELDYDIESAGAFIDLMEENLKGIYTVAVGKSLEGLHRTVREACRATGKLAKLSIVGGELTLDRRLLETLYAPLVHLLRNAVDHGLEAPEERDAAGKHKEGALLLRFEQEGNWLKLEIGDDGKGMDPLRIREAATRKGLISPDKASTLSDSESLELIFLPGFSTKEEVGSLSGRGVGMDVVKDAVKSLQGRVEIQASPGQGSRFLMTLPLTLGASPMLVLRAGTLSLGLPTLAVESLVKAEASKLDKVGEEWRFQWEGQWLRMADLSALLGLRGAEAPTAGASVVILQVQGRKLALVAEHLEGNEELVILPLPDGLLQAPAFQGAAAHAGADLLLVLRPEWLVEQGEKGRGRLAAGGLRALVIDDSLTARAMHRGILESGGYAVHAASSGAQGLQMLEKGSYDVVICDVSMEGMDGLEFTRQAKGGANPLRAPVILVSAMEGEEARSSALSSGAEAFLSKKDCAAGKLLAEVARVRAALSREGALS